MALSVTWPQQNINVSGGHRETWGTLAFDSSYLVGGEAWTAANFGLFAVDHLTVNADNGYTFEVDYTNKLLKVFKAQSLGVIHVDTTDVGNVGAGTDDLITFSVPANTLSANGMGLRITAFGTTANNANAKTVTLNFGSVAIMTQALTASIAGSWRIAGEVIRVGAASQDCIVGLTQGATDIAHAEFTATTQDETAAITVKCTGAATSDNDIVQEGLLVELLAPQGTGATGVEVLSTADLSGLTGVRWRAVGI